MEQILNSVAVNPEVEVSESVGQALDVFVARQPIFDTENRLGGYELLYRNSAQATAAGGFDSDLMATEVFVRAVLNFGLERLTGDVPAFLNFTRAALLDERYRMLEPARVVIELLEHVEPDDEVFRACLRLRNAGYLLALDDFEYHAGWNRFLPLVDIIKVDVLGKSPAEIATVAGRLLPTGVRLLAERVEDDRVRRQCEEVGFSLFQGYFFARPETVTRRDLSLEQLTILKLMNLLDDPGTAAAEIEEAFRTDVSLSYKLLRIVNSASIGGRGIESIRHATRIVGRATLHRWMALLLVGAVSRDSGAALELVQTAMLRARLCEAIAQRRGSWNDEAPLFLVGLFSLLDAILRVPMEEITAHIDLSPAVRDALLRAGGPYAPALALVEAYERGEWDRVGELSPLVGVSATEISTLYLEAVAWAQERTGQQGR
jgi:c-di-GMP phosphodiesterase